MLAVLAILCTVGPRFFFVSNRPLNPDEAIWTTAGQMINDGAIPYREVMDIKPPGILYLYAFACKLTPWSLIAIRWMRILTDMGTALLLLTAFRISNRGSTGWIAVLLWGLAANSYRPIDSQSAEAEPFAIFFVVLGVVLMIQALERNSLALAFCWGMAAFGGVMMKQPSGIEFLAIALGGLFLAWKKGLPVARIAGFVGAAVMGGLIPLAAVCYWLHRLQALDRMIFFCVTFVGQVYADAGGGLPAWLHFAKRTWPFHAIGLISVVWIALLAMRQKFEAKTVSIAALTPLWFAAALVGALIGSHPFDHYFLTTLVPLAVANGLTFGNGHSIAYPETVGRSRIAAFGMLGLVILQLGWNVGRHLWETVRQPDEPDLTELVGLAVKQNTGANDRIFVWVFFTDIYYYSQRLPACADYTAQYISGFDPIILGKDHKQRKQAWALEQTLREFAAHPPKVIVDFEDIYGLSMREFPELWKFVNENYVHADDMPFQKPDLSPGIVKLWVRR